jgi:hypothetical protein
MIEVDKNLYYTPKVHVVVAYPTLESVNAWLEYGTYPDDIKYIGIRSKNLLIKMFDHEPHGYFVGYHITEKCFVVLFSCDIEKVNLQKDGR